MHHCVSFCVTVSYYMSLCPTACLCVALHYCRSLCLSLYITEFHCVLLHMSLFVTMWMSLWISFLLVAALVFCFRVKIVLVVSILSYFKTDIALTLLLCLLRSWDKLFPILSLLYLIMCCLCLNILMLPNFLNDFLFCSANCRTESEQLGGEQNADLLKNFLQGN